jgi:hypothetical protein
MDHPDLPLSTARVEEGAIAGILGGLGLQRASWRG